MDRDWKTCFKDKSILVVEDDSINRDLMNDILSQMQCIVEFAFDGEDAVNKVSKKRYDLILMDVRMPNKDGMQATREIRALNHESKNTPIIALTASTLENESSIKQAGMTGMVSKPINLQELREKMAQILLG